MATIRTTNRVSRIWGDNPRRRRPSDFNTRITRGIVIYFQPHGLDFSGFFVRIFYKDYDNQIQNQKKLEEKILADYDGKTSKEITDHENLVSTLQERHYPRHYGDDITKIDFGRIPCNISYIMNSKCYVFLDDPHPIYSVPVTFRKNKIIDTGGHYHIKEFSRNHSFYNLKVRNFDFRDHPDACVIRMVNLMRRNGKGEIIDPNDMSPASRIDYCMDIQVIVDQTKLTQYLSVFVPQSANAELSTLSATDALIARLLDFIASITKKVIVVFDPPQSNGGNTGPPN